MSILTEVLSELNKKSLTEAKYAVDDYVEYQPRQGRSKNVRITKVLDNGKYETNIGKVISDKEILGQNLK